MYLNDENATKCCDVSSQSCCSRFLCVCYFVVLVWIYYDSIGRYLVLHCLNYDTIILFNK